MHMTSQKKKKKRRHTCPNSQILWNYFTIYNFSIQVHRKRDGKAVILFYGMQKEALPNDSKGSFEGKNAITWASGKQS